MSCLNFGNGNSCWRILKGFCWPLGFRCYGVISWVAQLAPWCKEDKRNHGMRLVDRPLWKTYNERQKCWDIPLFLAYLALKSPLPTRIYPPSPPNNVEFARWEPAFIPVQHWIGGGGICVWKSFPNSKKWNWVHCHYILENVSTTFVAHCPRWSYCYIAFFVVDGVLSCLHDIYIKEISAK